jgi:hypothetical protein
MKAQTKKPCPAPPVAMSNAPRSLHRIVSDLQIGLLPLSTERKTIIINDADKEMATPADEHILAFVIGSLLSNAVHGTANCCIRVETLVRQDQLQIRLSNNGMFRYSQQMFSMRQISAAAQKLQGNICLESEEPGETTVLFSLPIKKAA